jgi:hypothetical protein
MMGIAKSRSTHPTEHAGQAAIEMKLKLHQPIRSS